MLSNLAALLLCTMLYAVLPVQSPCDPAAPQVALIDLGAGTYKSFDGGLYADGSNDRPAGHENAGRAIAESIVPLDVQGNPHPSGRIVLISIGFSNMTQEWAVGAVGEPASQALTFTAKATALQATGIVNPRVLIVDGAQGGATATAWGATPPDMQSPPWSVALNRLLQRGSSRFQVQIACVKTAHGSPNQCIAPDGSSTGDAGLLAADFAAIARNLKIVFPNIRLAYFCSRTYGGYALTGLNPEPFAFEQAYGVKWMIQSQIDADGIYGDLNFDSAGGPVVSPWLSWGPYLWANGLTPNGQGLFWAADDFRPDDRTHPSGSGVDKASDVMLHYFLSDTTARPWFGWQCHYGDMNNNGTIDAADVPFFVTALLQPADVPVGARCRADVNNDGHVDGADIEAMIELLIDT